ncbi:MAG: hypothetical protein QOE69_1163 [Thermoleophilaceae bacterium]|nr:hypothetical protein [Thermoleophilaceae bacterium]
MDVSLALLVLGAFAFLVSKTSKVTEWLVMSDELQNARLAISMTDTLSPVPHVHGEYLGALSVLYPILLAPLYALFDATTAFQAVHILNAALIASAAIPAYLLARDVTGSRLAARLVAALSAFVPWAAMSLMVMTESAAYPVFLWTLLAFHRATVAPSARRDVIALVMVVVAFFARTQFVVLAAVLPAVIVLHELGLAVLGPGGSVRQAWPALRRAAREHVVVTVAVAIGLAGVGGLAAAGALGSVLGNYEVTATEGQLLPPGIHRSVVTHLDFVIVAIGVLPFVIGAAWLVVTFVRPLDRPAHAFAVMSLVTIPPLAYEVASFNLRFANGGVQDRYLFYVAPLLFIAMAAWLVDDRRRAVVPVVAAGILFALFADYAAYRASPGPFFSSPSSAFHQVLDGRTVGLGKRLGIESLAPATLISIFSVAAALALAVLVRWKRPRGETLLALVGIPVLLFCAYETSYVIDQMSAKGNGSRPAVGGSLEQRNWIDMALPDGATAGLVPSPEATFPVQSLWWETELFNKRADQSWAVGEGTTYTPFPAGRLRLDYDTGAVRADRPESEYLVTGRGDVRLGLDGELVKRNGDLRLLRPHRPYRADWATRDIDGVGLSLVSKNAGVRVYGRGRTELASVSMVLVAPPEDRRGYEVMTPNGYRSGSLAAGRSRPVRLELCVPADGFAGLVVRPTGRPAPLATTVTVTGLSVTRLGRGCAPA